MQWLYSDSKDLHVLKAYESNQAIHVPYHWHSHGKISYLESRKEEMLGWFGFFFSLKQSWEKISFNLLFSFSSC